MQFSPDKTYILYIYTSRSVWVLNIYTHINIYIHISNAYLATPRQTGTKRTWKAEKNNWIAHIVAKGNKRGQVLGP